MASNSFALDFSPANSLFKRCLQCPPIAPTCPPCKADEVCSQTLGDCNNCASASCVKTISSGSTTASTSSGSSGPNVGAIVGGVIGGVAVISIAVFCIWKFWLKGYRHEVEDDWDDPDYPLEKPNGSVFRDARSSTHTVASMASTVLTRASNIIQIAYIPGVTNRTASASPGLLVPPVPPIPIATTPSSTTTSHFDDQHFFVPGDLRDSTYSDISALDVRRPGSIASSLARNSVATTVYRDSAVVNPMPAQTIISGKAAVVSVKSGASMASSPAMTSPGTPPVPTIDVNKHIVNAGRKVTVKIPSSSDIGTPKGAGSAVTTPSGSIRTMKPVALQIVRKGTKPPATASSSGSSTAVDSAATSPTPDKKNMKSDDEGEEVGIGLRPLSEETTASTLLTGSPHSRARQSTATGRSSRLVKEESDEEDEDSHDRSRQSLLRGQEQSDIREQKVRSPFSDDEEAPKTPTMAENRHVSQMIKPKPRAAAEKAKKEEKDEERGKSPFEDDNAI